MAQGSLASLQHQNAGSIPGLAEWVKGSSVGCSCIHSGSGISYAAGQPEKGKKKKVIVRLLFHGSTTLQCRERFSLHPLMPTAVGRQKENVKSLTHRKIHPVASSVVGGTG